MKTKALIIALTTLSFLSAKAEKADSVVTICNADKIVITESNDGLEATISADGKTQSFKQNYTPNATVVSSISASGFSLTRKNNAKKSSISWDLISGGLGFGFCSAPGAPNAAGIEMGKSFELSWLNILAIQARNRFGNTFSLGVGINWRNYRTTLDNMFTVENGQIGIDSYPEGSRPRLSRIKIFSVQFPLLYRQRLPFGLSKEKMVLTFGPIFNLNTHASVLSAWKDGTTSSEYKINGVNVRPFTIDLFAQVHLHNFMGLYARYSPYHALTGHNAVNFHQFSTGVIFFM